MTRRSIEDITARADEFADAFENYAPKLGDQDAPLPPAMASSSPPGGVTPPRKSLPRPCALRASNACPGAR